MSAPKQAFDPAPISGGINKEKVGVSRDGFSYEDMSQEWRDQLLDPLGWDKLLETFASTMRLAVALTDPQGNLVGRCHSPQPVWRMADGMKPRADNTCPFCLSHPGICNAVTDAWKTGAPVIVEDSAGLAHVTVPLSLGGQELGTLIAGQVFTCYPQPLLLERAARDLGVSRQKLWHVAIQQVPITLTTLQRYGDLLISLGHAFLGERYAAILQKRLAQTSERFRLFIDGAKGYALHTVDATGCVTSWNRGAERMFGYTETEIVGKNARGILIPEDAYRNVAQAMVEANQSGWSEFEAWQLHKNGTRFLGAGVLASIGTEDVPEYGKLIRDVTTLRRSEQDLQQAQKLESLGVLAGGIAHDFNNLLTGIIMSLSFVKTSLPPEDPTYPMVEIAEQSAARAAELVAQLLAHAGKGRFVITRFDFSALISEMLPLISASIPKNVDLELLLAPGLPSIEADASQIRQVVMNLIINGAEAIGTERGTVRVLTGASTSGNEVFMEVKDSGSGMTDTTKARMFDPFFTTKLTGRGLGLAAVSGIVRVHNGKMQVDSIPGHGTTFTVSFPATHGPVLSVLNTPPLLNSPCDIGKVLIVDDESALRKMAQVVLENSGYSVLVAKDGEEGVDLYAKNAEEIAVVLLDMMMPVMPGPEAFRLIREIQPHVPIILSSGYSEVFAIEEFGGGLVADFIQKPYTAAKLIESVRKACASSHRVRKASAYCATEERGDPGCALL